MCVEYNVSCILMYYFFWYTFCHLHIKMTFFLHQLRFVLDPPTRAHTMFPNLCFISTN